MKYWVLFILCFAIAPLVGCSSSDGNETTDDVGGSDTDVVAGDVAELDGSSDATDTVESTDPLVLVPPEALSSGTPNAECPPEYQSNGPEEGQNGGFEADSQERSFLLHLPSETFTGPRPLLISFHGTDGTGESAYSSYELHDFVGAGFISLGLDGNANGEIWPVWDGLREAGDESLPNPDLTFFDSAVACLASYYEVDANRIYIVGQSAGGIMVNHVLQRRSDLLAGGIAASGMFDLTSPDPIPDFGPMAVAVTWGGDNDEWSGTANGTTEVPAVNFVEQAAVASAFWEGQNDIHQIYCSGEDLGHVFLSQVNDLFIDYFLSHPKGLSDNPNWTLTEPDASTEVVCSEDVATYESVVTVTCEDSDTTGCTDFCQFAGDCVVENATVSPVLGPQLSTIGFSGDDSAECGGCVTACEDDVADGGEPDEAVASCFASAAEAASCGPGIPGAFPFINAVNSCCEDETDSLLCTRICTTLLENDVAISFFDSCLAFE